MKSKEVLAVMKRTLLSKVSDAYIRVVIRVVVISHFTKRTLYYASKVLHFATVVTRNTFKNKIEQTFTKLSSTRKNCLRH